MGKQWTKEDLVTLEKVYPNTSNREIAKLFPGREEMAIRDKANDLGIKKSKKYQGLLLKERVKMLNEGRAAKIGQIRIWSYSKRGETYTRKFIKMGPGKKGWRKLHEHNWKKATGKKKVPAGYHVAFKDNKYLNCFPSNLELRPNSKQKKDWKKAKA